MESSKNSELAQRQKMLGIIKEGKEKKIYVSHLTIRQSISFLLSKLILVEVIAGIAVIVFHIFILSTRLSDIYQNVNYNFEVFNAPLFILLVIFKTSTTIVLVIKWLIEYYEIYPTEVIHIRGLLFRREETFKLSHIESIKVEQGMLGRVFNYGTVRLFDWVNEKEIKLLLIHNPRKYASILEDLLPAANLEKRIFREHLIYEDEK